MTDEEFERAVSAHYAAVFRFALSLTKTESDACDLTQESFARLAGQKLKLRDNSKVKSWLLTTCYREFLRDRRHRAHFPEVELTLAEESLPALSPDELWALDAAALMDAMRQVPEVYRVPLVLFYLQEQSYKEIAALLEIAIGTVMSRLARGKEALRSLLASKNNHLSRIDTVGTATRDA